MPRGPGGEKRPADVIRSSRTPAETKKSGGRCMSAWNPLLLSGDTC